MKKIINIMAAAALICLAASCEKAPKEPTDFSGGCEAVDLGLSVKWASYNVGAHNVDLPTVEDRGSYFAWGETMKKEEYDWLKPGDYKWGVYDSQAKPKYGMTKYTSGVKGGDRLNKLQPGDDAATVNWGTKWRTPTLDEIKELVDGTKCEWTWDATRKGYTIKSLANGNSIFLPAAGCHTRTEMQGVGVRCCYWSSSVDESTLHDAYYFLEQSYNTNFRFCGFTVRAVTEY